MTRPLSALLPACLCGALLFAPVALAGPRGGGARAGGGAVQRDGGGFQGDRNVPAYGVRDDGAYRDGGYRDNAYGDGGYGGGAYDASTNGAQGSRGNLRQGTTSTDGGERSQGTTTLEIDQDTATGTKTTTYDGANGETATHTGTVSKEDGYVTYEGDSSTSTGRSSSTNGAAARTDDGFVAGGTTTNNHGSAAAVGVVNENGVKAAGIATNGETVRAGAYSNNPAYAANRGGYYAYPMSAYGARVYNDAYGDPIYWWPATPLVTANVAAVVDGAQTMLPAAYSPVVSYQTPIAMVYATSFPPHALYSVRAGDRYYWVPGAAIGTAEAQAAISNASSMPGPTGGSTLIGYDVNGETVYLTNDAPITGIYEQRLGPLHGWIPGVSTPSPAQLQALDIALTAHADGGSEALAAAAQAYQGS